MKVLLLQEMSGVHMELKKGLQFHGIDVQTATLGDTFKKYNTDIYLGNDKNTKKASLERIFYQLQSLPKIKTFDIVQTISPSPFHKLISQFMEQQVFENKKSIFVSAGADPVYRYFVQELDYYPPIDEYANKNKYKSFLNKLKRFDKVIPLNWENYYSMKKSNINATDILPFPIDIEKHTPMKKSNDKLVFFHPLNRIDLNYDFKGTLIIKEVFEELSKKYDSNQVEFLCKGNMTYNEYFEFINNVDVLVDQIYSYNYGMSAAYAMAKGQIVLSGIENVVRYGFNEKCPIINLKPDKEFVKNKIEEIIENRGQIKQMKIASRAFAEQYLDSKKVALQFLNIYNAL